MRAFKLFTSFFLWFLKPAFGQTYQYPVNNVLGVSPCYISKGCIIKI